MKYRLVLISIFCMFIFNICVYADTDKHVYSKNELENALQSLKENRNELGISGYSIDYNQNSIVVQFEGRLTEDQKKKIEDFIDVNNIIFVKTRTIIENNTNSIMILFKNSILNPSSEPFIYNNRVLVVARDIFEILGYEIKWDDVTRTVIASNDSLQISITEGENYILCTDTFGVYKTIYIDTPAMIKNDRIYIPLRAISETADCEVEWLEETLSIYID